MILIPNLTFLVQTSGARATGAPITVVTRERMESWHACWSIYIYIYIYFFLVTRYLVYENNVYLKKFEYLVSNF